MAIWWRTSEFGDGSHDSGGYWGLRLACSFCSCFQIIYNLNFDPHISFIIYLFVSVLSVYLVQRLSVNYREFVSVPSVYMNWS
ncbi:hypothetical protein HanPI659440_Chr14g0541571 [Helianthus annuus]|nr:hypothetical protein HanPI659440_Chr14g0541571 [Helianthus annuus]